MSLNRPYLPAVVLQCFFRKYGANTAILQAILQAIPLNVFCPLVVDASHHKYLFFFWLTSPEGGKNRKYIYDNTKGWKYLYLFCVFFSNKYYQILDILAFFCLLEILVLRLVYDSGTIRRGYNTYTEYLQRGSLSNRTTAAERRKTHLVRTLEFDSSRGNIRLNVNSLW